MKLAFKIRSKFRTFLKNGYYRLTVPINRLAKNRWIEDPRSFSIEISSLCNFNCVFCAYQHTTDKMRKIMNYEEFVEAVDQVVNCGGSIIELTPLTGDILTDRKGIIKKLEYLQNNKNIKEFSFTTNASLLSEKYIKEFLRFDKIRSMKVSIYGHDKDSFEKITQTVLYEKVIENLNILHRYIDKIPFRISLGIRSYYNFSTKTFDNANKDLSASKIQKIISILKKKRNVDFGYHRHYTNWGGYVTKDDLKGLPIILKDDQFGYKSGPCSRLFTYMILSNSDLILCGCRDGMREMVIGNIKENNLSFLISNKNKKYIQWIEDQEKDLFNGPCKNCDFYSPVYSYPHHQFFTKNKMKYVNDRSLFNN